MKRSKNSVLWDACGNDVGQSFVLVILEFYDLYAHKF